MSFLLAFERVTLVWLGLEMVGWFLLWSIKSLRTGREQVHRIMRGSTVLAAGAVAVGGSRLIRPDMIVPRYDLWVLITHTIAIAGLSDLVIGASMNFRNFSPRMVRITMAARFAGCLVIAGLYTVFLL